MSVAGEGVGECCRGMRVRLRGRRVLVMQGGHTHDSPRRDL